MNWSIFFQISLLASRLTNTSELLDVITITSDQLDSFGELLDGFDVSFFKELSEEALHTSTVLSRVTFASKAKVLFKFSGIHAFCVVSACKKRKVSSCSKTESISYLQKLYSPKQ